MRTDLSTFTTDNFNPGPTWKVITWYLFNYYIFDSSIPWPYSIKRTLLRLYGAKVGKGVVIKTKVRIKYPWKLTIGNFAWLGESVWIDNLVNVDIGNHVALSQGSMLLTGNHDYTQSNFPYRLGEIVLEDGVWIGARSVVCPNVICKSHAILTVNSVANKTLEEWSIYAGNPAVFIRPRKMTR